MIVAPRGGIQILIGQRSADAAPRALSGESEFGVPPLTSFLTGHRLSLRSHSAGPPGCRVSALSDFPEE